MKTNAFWVFLQWIVVTISVQAQAVNQPAELPYLRSYVTDVRLIGQSHSQQTGVLFAVNDSALVLAPANGLKSTLQTIADQRGGTLPSIDSLGYFVPLRMYKYKQISRLSLHRRGYALKGMLLGIGVGMIVGFVQGDDPPGFLSFSAGEKAIGTGVIFAPLGILGSLFTVKSVNAKEQSVATEMKGRLRGLAIVEQLRTANLYEPLPPTVQESILPQPGPKAQTLGRQWTLSVSVGSLPVFDPSAAIVQKMKETGWASREPRRCFFFCSGPVYYPRVERLPGFDLEVGYRKSVRHGIMVSLGLPLRAEITGRTPSGTYLYLNSRLWYASYRWAWFSNNGRLVGSIGPAVLLTQDSQRWESPTHSQFRPGLHTSGQYRFVNRRIWLIAAKVDARWGSPASTGKYEQTQYMYSPTGSQQKILTFPSVTLPAFQVNAGFQFGFKM